MNSNLLKVSGELTLQRFDATGQLVETRHHKNLVVTSGLTYIAARMSESGRPNQMSHMGLGTSATTPSASDTSLGAQAGSREALTSQTPSGTSVTYVASFAAGAATGALTEAGIFNASSAGTMLCRSTFPVINKGASDSLVVTWVVSVSAAT